ncbi:MAG: iron export ABC transporter permease subunit FetB [Pirellulaceae bacterium]|nr:iron export ABC transporter permease subunit FetB [Planctomycetales bacterium]
MNEIELSNWQVAAAAAMVLINAAVSLALGLRLEKTLLISALRTIVQLMLIGAVLEWVFAVDRWYVVLALLSIMTIVAGYSATQRNQRRYRGMIWDTMVSVWASAWLVAAVGILVVLRGHGAWHQPQYVIPLTGMILGNAMNGISLGMNSFSESLVTRRDEIEALLAMGATRWEAALPYVQLAVRTGMIPIINMMTVVGIVSLPGMMTGQLLSGSSPMNAVRYQIVIIFLIASAVALGTVSVILLGFLRVFNTHHQFQADRLDSPHLP